MKHDSPRLTAAQLRAARAFLEINQDALAAMAKVSRSSIADFERGARLPHADTLERLEAALAHLGVELLFAGYCGIGIKVEPTASMPNTVQELQRARRVS